MPVKQMVGPFKRPPDPDTSLERARARVEAQIDVMLGLHAEGKDTHDARRLLETYVEALELLMQTKQEKT